LDDEGSIPADVVRDVYDDVVEDGEDLEAGDVLAVVDVVDKAVAVSLIK